MEEYITPGTAGLAQRISPNYEISGEKMDKETSKLFALTRNEVMSCTQNQY